MINENPAMFKPDYIVAFKKYLRQISNDSETQKSNELERQLKTV